MKLLILLIKKVHTNIPGFLKLVSLNRLNKPISESLLSKLAQLSTIPYVEF